jgi:hypothetical protein|tara:strand:- start:100 stop:207 length:108 start_codon:yes stop_codon:yes gene_type:complete
VHLKVDQVVAEMALKARMSFLLDRAQQQLLLELTV